MTFAFDTRRGHRTVALQVVASDPFAHYELNLDTFELCTFDALSKTIRRDVSDMHISDAVIACITPTLNAIEGVTLDKPVLSGKGADHHAVRGILEKVNDLLVSVIPGGLPPELFDAEGNPIEHTIDVDLDAVPFKRSPRPFTAERGCRDPTILEGFSCQGLGRSIPIFLDRACVVCACHECGRG